MLESNKQRSARKKREKQAAIEAAALVQQQIDSRFAPHGIPFEDEPLAIESAVTEPVFVESAPYQPSIWPDTTIAGLLAIGLLVLVIL